MAGRIAFFGLLIFIIIFLASTMGGCDRVEDWYQDRAEISDQPPRPFREKCEMAKAFRLYKDHDGKWACKLDDGRVWTEGKD